MTLLEQLLTGALAGALTVATLGGAMELKAYLEERVEEHTAIVEQYDEIIEGADIDEILATIEGG